MSLVDLKNTERKSNSLYCIKSRWLIPTRFKCILCMCQEHCFLRISREYCWSYILYERSNCYLFIYTLTNKLQSNIYIKKSNMNYNRQNETGNSTFY